MHCLSENKDNRLYIYQPGLYGIHFTGRCLQYKSHPGFEKLEMFCSVFVEISLIEDK